MRFVIDSFTVKIFTIVVVEMKNILGLERLFLDII